MQYELANDVEKLAKRLIREDHDLASRKIVFVYELKKDKNDQAVAQMRKGKAKVADVKIIGGLQAFLISGEEATDENGPDAFVVMTISKHAWNALSDSQRARRQLMPSFAGWTTTRKPDGRRSSITTSTRVPGTSRSMVPGMKT